MSVDRALLNRLPTISERLFAQKAAKKLSFETIGEKLGRNEIWVASLFYGQAKPEDKDIGVLAQLLDIPESELELAMGESFFPDKCKLIDLPPRDPLLYRLYEIVASFGYAYKAIIHEKFGDGIMSAIAFDSKIEKVEVDGAPWVQIVLRGKFLPYKRF